MALIKNSTELKTHLGSIQKNMNFATIQPFITQAEIKYMIPYLGAAFYAELDALHAGDTATGIPAQLITRLARSLAFYSYLEALPMLNVHMGDLGIQQQSDSENTSNPTNGWSFHKAEHQASTNADRFLDHSLEYIEANIDDAGLATFKASSIWSDFNDLLISNASDFDQHVSIAKSRRTFQLLKPHIKRVEKQIIKAKISPEQYSELITEKKAGTLTADNQILLDLLQPAVASLAMFEALPYLAIQISGTGIHIINENENVRQKLQAPATEKSLIQEKLFAAGQSELNGIIRFLYDNPANYATFAASSTYKPEQDPAPFEHKSQENKKSFFA